ncbi:MAG TPA: V-type ATP synthase subunit F [Kofleriaceae bacterium]|nr:V-type ATP synthase subunit F [Kofleriaceae bacterium]
MKTALRVLCRRPTAIGIALAGIAPIEADDAEAAAAALARTHDAGIVLVEQALYDALPPALVRAIRRAGSPILLPFPGPAAAARAAAPEQELLEVLRRAIGYRVRLR